MQNPNFESQAGDILYGKNNRNIPGPRPHFMIYLGPTGDPNHEFLGAMLTHESGRGNISLENIHFEEFKPSGHPWQVKFDRQFGSFIVDDLFRKLVDWQPFSKVGQLTPEGLAFVRQNLDGHQPRYAPWNA
jgi:hypothetical protein